MKSLHNRLVCFFLAAVMLLTCLPTGAVIARADDFPNTHVNTGNQRADLVGVALTQEGFREGSNNYTKYGVWFGHPNMAWCAAFICWCADQAGIPTTIIKKNGFASAKHFGLTSFTIDDRLPQSGDLFFKNDGNHTGIVYYIEGDYFWTVEGNTYINGGTGGVYVRRRSLYGEYNFASPNYQSDGSSTEHNYIKGMETAHPHKEYYKCSHCGNMYYTGGKGTVAGCRECEMENCSHTYGDYKKTDDSNHSATCSKCGKKSTLSHTWKDDKVLEEVTCENPGIKTQKCQQCGATREITIPQTNQHQYSDWTRLDEDKHVRKCETCGREQEEAHKKAKWSSDVFEHWYECEVCEGRGGNEVHNFSGDCESACTVCKYTSASGHLFDHQWKRDPTYHWQECENCSAVEGKTAHQFENDCDSTCDTCGYIRQVTHEYASTMESNETGHWRRCTLCGQAEKARAHVLGAAATEDSAQLCKECGFVAVPALPHVHSYSPFRYDGNSHWGTCDCGEEMEAQKHIWDMKTQACLICDSELPEFRDDTYLWFILLGAAGVLLLLIIIAIIVAVIRKKMMRAAARAAFREMDREGELTDAPQEETENSTV